MPTYAYRCTACEHAFEVQQSFSDDALTVCPECEGRLRKVFSAVGVVFKGSGFYRTDARAGGSTTASTTGKTTSSGSSSSSSTGSSSSAASPSTAASGGSSSAPKAASA
ncbi:FmdB family transcriptional regulator [Cellulomonas sp. JZ18]|uniref:FmdB family zinc ribbon protein n=1 Tax=Cellulomonas sp. JZ18 TaxID=2654191 RepID=UPI0012D3C37A|nr:FmdB family zinc ribbon protein [Cellulomonas sp. JZ18]QGQ20181.1 FmdB family transcriptional regulator [Cellulomonas sp. JZ18]